MKKSLLCNLIIFYNLITGTIYTIPEEALNKNPEEHFEIPDKQKLIEHPNIAILENEQLTEQTKTTLPEEPTTETHDDHLITLTKTNNTVHINPKLQDPIISSVAKNIAQQALIAQESTTSLREALIAPDTTKLQKETSSPKETFLKKEDPINISQKVKMLIPSHAEQRTETTELRTAVTTLFTDLNLYYQNFEDINTKAQTIKTKLTTLEKKFSQPPTPDQINEFLEAEKEYNDAVTTYNTMAQVHSSEQKQYQQKLENLKTILKQRKNRLEFHQMQYEHLKELESLHKLSFDQKQDINQYRLSIILEQEQLAKYEKIYQTYAQLDEINASCVTTLETTKQILEKLSPLVQDHLKDKKLIIDTPREQQARNDIDYHLQNAQTELTIQTELTSQIKQLDEHITKDLNQLNTLKEEIQRIINEFQQTDVSQSVEQGVQYLKEETTELYELIVPKKPAPQEQYAKQHFYENKENNTVINEAEQAINTLERDISEPHFQMQLARTQQLAQHIREIEKEYEATKLRIKSNMIEMSSLKERYNQHESRYQYHVKQHKEALNTYIKSKRNAKDATNTQLDQNTYTTIVQHLRNRYEPQHTSIKTKKSDNDSQISQIDPPTKIDHQYVPSHEQEDTTDDIYNFDNLYNLGSYQQQYTQIEAAYKAAINNIPYSFYHASELHISVNNIQREIDVAREEINAFKEEKTATAEEKRRIEEQIIAEYEEAMKQQEANEQQQRHDIFNKSVNTVIPNLTSFQTDLRRATKFFEEKETTLPQAKTNIDKAIHSQNTTIKLATTLKEKIDALKKIIDQIPPGDKNEIDQYKATYLAELQSALKQYHDYEKRFKTAQDLYETNLEQYIDFEERIRFTIHNYQNRLNEYKAQAKQAQAIIDEHNQLQYHIDAQQLEAAQKRLDATHQEIKLIEETIQKYQSILQNNNAEQLPTNNEQLTNGSTLLTSIVETTNTIEELIHQLDNKIKEPEPEEIPHLMTQDERFRMLLDHNVDNDDDRELFQLSPNDSSTEYHTINTHWSIADDDNDQKPRRRRRSYEDDDDSEDDPPTHQLSKSESNSQETQEHIHQVQNQAATTIQKHVRGIKTRKQTQALREQNAHQQQLQEQLAHQQQTDLENHAATTIQKHVRGIKARKQAQAQQEQLHYEQDAQQRLQHAHLTRKQQYAQALEHEQQNDAATTIQKHVRGIKARKQTQALREQNAHQQQLQEQLAHQQQADLENHAATTIQKHVRGIKARKQAQAEQEQLHYEQDAQQRLQHAHLTRKQQHAQALEHEQQNDAATTIQKHIRGIKARKQTQALREQNAHQQQLQEQLAHQQQADLENQAATTIQKHVRGIKARKQTQAQQEQLHYEQDAQQRLQHTLLTRKQQHAQALEHEQQNDAATTIQKHIRGIKARKQTQALREQNAHQQQLQEQLAHQQQADLENHAATTIQKHVRGIKARKQAQAQQEQLHYEQDAQQRLQHTLLTRKQQHAQALEHEQQNDAATTIQKHIRGIKARKQTQALREQKSSILINPIDDKSQQDILKRKKRSKRVAYYQKKSPNTTSSNQIEDKKDIEYNRQELTLQYNKMLKYLKKQQEQEIDIFTPDAHDILHIIHQEENRTLHNIYNHMTNDVLPHSVFTTQEMLNQQQELFDKALKTSSEAKNNLKKIIQEAFEQKNHWKNSLKNARDSLKKATTTIEKTTSQEKLKTLKKEALEQREQINENQLMQEKHLERELKKEMSQITTSTIHKKNKKHHLHIHPSHQHHEKKKKKQYTDNAEEYYENFPIKKKKTSTIDRKRDPIKTVGSNVVSINIHNLSPSTTA